MASHLQCSCWAWLGCALHVASSELNPVLVWQGMKLTTLAFLGMYLYVLVVYLLLLVPSVWMPTMRYIFLLDTVPVVGTVCTLVVFTLLVGRFSYFYLTDTCTWTAQEATSVQRPSSGIRISRKLR